MRFPYLIPKKYVIFTECIARFCILVPDPDCGGDRLFRAVRRPRCAYAPTVSRPTAPGWRIPTPRRATSVFYDSIESKTNRRAVPRMLYKMLS